MWKTYRNTNSHTNFKSYIITGDTGAKKLAYCGGYKSDGVGTGRDALLIPSLEKETGATVGYSNVCGQAGLTDGAASPKTLCCNYIISFTYLTMNQTITFFAAKRLPFTVTFTSDSLETNAELGAGNNKGFQLAYIQS